MSLSNKFIIIEGPDNVGKSTLITNLKNYFNNYVFQTLHFSNINGLNTEQLIDYNNILYSQMFDFMELQLETKQTGIICDRSHISEMVYSPLYRNYNGDYVLDIEKQYKNNAKLWNNLSLITLIDDPENIIQRDDGLSFSTNIDKKKEEIQLFKTSHDKSLISNKLLLNINDLDATSLANTIFKWLGEQNV